MVRKGKNKKEKKVEKILTRKERKKLDTELINLIESDVITTDSELKKLAKKYKQKYSLLKTALKDLRVETKPEFKLRGVKDSHSELREKVYQNIILKDNSTATELIVTEIKNNNKIYTIRDDENSEMWIYSNGIYIPEGKTYIKEVCREILGKAYTTHFNNTIIDKISADTYIDSKEFFINDNSSEIAVQNGILNIKTKELSEFTSKKIFFNKIPVTFDSTKKCPTINEHFESVLANKEDIPVMKELFGYLLLKDLPIEKAVMNCGTGRNGKGKTLELMKRFLGAENCINIPLQQFENDKFALGLLFNKMANLGGDISPQALKRTGNFKQTTGRDMISADRKFKPRVHFVSFAKQIFNANTLPETYDLTPAFFNRWVIFDFPYTFVSDKEYKALEDKTNFKIADTSIIKKLITSDELSGLLNESLEALVRLLKQEDFSYSKTVAEVKEMWLRRSSSFTAFLLDCVTEEWDAKITTLDLRKAYTHYCKIYKLKSASDKAINNSLSNMGVCREREYIDKKQVYYWSGIKFSLASLDSLGFSLYTKKVKTSLGSNTPSNPTSQTKPSNEDKESRARETDNGLEEKSSNKELDVEFIKIEENPKKKKKPK